MNDTELDELLNSWKAPEAPASLRARVQTGFAEAVGQKTAPRVWPRRVAALARRTLLATAFLALGACLLLVVTAAFPQTATLLSPRVPYTVDSEFIRFAEDGSSSVVMYLTSYNNNGMEVVLSTSYPGNPFMTVYGGVRDAVRRLVTPFTISAEEMEDRARANREQVRAGCVVGTPTTVGRETILNLTTTAHRFSLGRGEVMTVWMAPALGCFVLRAETEVPRPDGTLRLLDRKEALKVTRYR